ncbi:hypothetical protein E8E11_004303 [Didymella keratinophila]|nr:hypothetical protein E8E11_004303 [Didymella keratinophila]
MCCILFNCVYFRASPEPKSRVKLSDNPPPYDSNFLSPMSHRSLFAPSSPQGLSNIASNNTLPSGHEVRTPDGIQVRDKVRCCGATKF